MAILIAMPVVYGQFDFPSSFGFGGFGGFGYAGPFGFQGLYNNYPGFIDFIVFFMVFGGISSLPKVLEAKNTMGIFTIWSSS